jgi:hypothetical protein
MTGTPPPSPADNDAITTAQTAHPPKPKYDVLSVARRLSFDWAVASEGSPTTGDKRGDPSVHPAAKLSTYLHLGTSCFPTSCICGEVHCGLKAEDMDETESQEGEAEFHRSYWESVEDEVNYVSTMLIQDEEDREDYENWARTEYAKYNQE